MTSDVTFVTLKSMKVNIREIRKRLNLTQQQLADKVGVYRETIARWESGESKPSPLALREIERLLRKRKK